jgi:hypothetical protein
MQACFVPVDVSSRSESGSAIMLRSHYGLFLPAVAKTAILS